MSLLKKAGAVLALAGFTLCVSNAAHAVPVRVTVTNTATDGGFFLTPVYFGFHDGSVDLFDVGSAASTGIENIAEVGSFSALAAERQAIQPDTVGAAAGMTPLAPGETRSFVVDLDAINNQYLFFASMLLPSNDTFIGVDNPLMFDLFNDMGQFVDQVIDVTTSFAYDAGTEVNDPTIGPAFVDGQAIMAGIDENGVITAASSLDNFLGLLLANGGFLDQDATAFLNNPNFSFARIEISEVPLPPALGLMAIGLAGLGANVMRRKA